MIVNENDFLGFVIEHCDNDGVCDKGIILDELNGNQSTLLDYINELSVKGLIQSIGINELRITEKGRTSYIPESQRIEEVTIKATKDITKYIFDILKIVVGGVIGAWLCHHFGW